MRRRFTIAAVLLIVFLILGVGYIPAAAQPSGGVNLSEFLRLVVYPTFNSYSHTNTTSGGAIMFERTYACGTVRFTPWQTPSAGHTGRVFVRQIGGYLHVQTELQYRPILLEGYRSPLERQYQYNVDGSLSDYDRGYFARLNRWASYRCLDLEYQLRTNNEFSRLYARFLRQAGGAKKFVREFQALGFESDGFPTEEGTLDDLNEALDLNADGTLGIAGANVISTGDPDLDSYLKTGWYSAAAGESERFIAEQDAIGKESPVCYTVDEYGVTWAADEGDCGMSQSTYNFIRGAAFTVLFVVVVVSFAVIRSLTRVAATPDSDPGGNGVAGGGAGKGKQVRGRKRVDC